MFVDVGIRFEVQEDAREPLHDALRALRRLTVEAPTVEAGEHYADLIRLALERAG